MTPQKIHGRPIERSQTEILPLRSAKMIPITHHKLLSPIKSPQFTPTKNAFYIMEAASKMIDPNPRTAVHGRMASQASPSIPLRIRDLKDRMEASQKSLILQKAKVNAVRSNANRKEAMTLNGSVDVPKMKAPMSSVRSSPDSTRIRGKVGPRSEVVRSNAQRRGGPPSSSTKNFPSKVFNESVSKHDKTSRITKLLLCSKSSTTISDLQGLNTTGRKKKRFFTVLFGPTVSVALEGSVDEDDVAATDTVKQYSMSKGMKTHQQKRPKSETNHSEDMMFDMVLVSKDGKSIQCKAVIDGSSSWGLGNNKDVMDVISFTFATPIKKPVSRSEDTGHVMGGGQPNGGGSYNLPNTKMLNLSPLRFNGIGVDALSILLDQKLKELTCRIDSFSGTFNESQETSFQDSVPSSKVIRTSSDEYNNTCQYCGLYFAHRATGDFHTGTKESTKLVRHPGRRRPHKLERKLMFDCILELTNHRCKQLTTGCCRTWRKWSTFSQLAGSFSNELCKEIRSWKNMEELMVDEVVEREMSSGLGRWVDFDIALLVN
uniref:DUF4378 domain-containing protein n=1 Tax=Kalanchoe fedtschenkoi TaxID=63787 RepID=A0A7N0VNI6_KALFE